ncbi:MAG: exonuclease SbcC [Paraglaciecola sp.]|jgi:exonuclease SbcC
MEYKGSKWRKWDLHVHTPISTHQNYGGDKSENWDKYVKQIEDLTNPYSVMGVNDYFTIEGYKKLIKFQEKGKLQNIELFPIIELRVRTFGSLGDKDAWKRVNLHVLFDNKNIEQIETQFLNLLKFEYSTIFKKTGLNRKNLIEFGECIIAETPVEKRLNTSPISVGFNNLNFSYRDICELLEKSGLNYIIALGKAEWDALRWDASIAEKKDIINRSHLMFTASASVKAYQRSANKLIEQSIKIPLLDCSDAHSYCDETDKDDNLIKDRLGNCNTWIKADKTFEGLKQVLYEPQNRLFIGELAPILPPRQIKSLKINFPSHTLIGRKGDKLEKASTFCLKGEKTINFSPFFTCLIGGRGSGKSTVLNLIAQKLEERNSFFDINNLYTIEGESTKKVKDLEPYVDVDGTSEVEYISQNQVEAFAEDKEELTSAIYERIVQNPKDSTGLDFRIIENKIIKNVERINAQIKDVKTVFEKRTHLKETKTFLSNDELIVNSSKNPQYSTITKQINTSGEKIEKINSSKLNYEELTTSLESLITKYDVTLVSPNIIDVEIQKIIGELKATLKNKFDEKIINNEIEKLTKEQILFSGKLEDYLKSQGLSQENINDYERAVKAIPQHKTAIELLTSEIENIDKSTKKFEEERKIYVSDRANLELLIKENLIPLNEDLKSTNPNVKDISFEYQYDIEKAKAAIFEDFWNYFEYKRPKEFGLNSPSDAVQRYLFGIEPQEVLTQTKVEFVSQFNTNNPKQAEQYLLKLFEEDAFFEIYQLIILRVLINPIKFKWITGFYDSKELRNCSFGQRCTAVIVALLNFGNKPLIIDEPEAHLDSKLIAEYLVDLVKRRKEERQIIFATHNANFVVNGDAELILHLEVDEHNETIITPLTIENTIHRDKLLLLEGGEEAFKKRDKRLIN